MKRAWLLSVILLPMAAMCQIINPGGGSGSGTVNSATLGQGAYYGAAGTAVSGSSGTLYDGSGNLKWQDFTEQAAPSNPASGKERVYADSGTHLLSCLTSGGTSCFPVASPGGTINQPQVNDGSGGLSGVALGATGTVLTSTGTGSSPTFQAPTIQVATVTLSSSQIKNLHPTIVTAIAAQGAGKVIVVQSAFAQYKFATTAYTSTEIDIILEYPVDNSTGFRLTSVGLLDQTANAGEQFWNDAPANAAGYPYPETSLSNAALVVGNNSGLSNLADGDGTLTITIYYTVLTLS